MARDDSDRNSGPGVRIVRQEPDTVRIVGDIDMSNAASLLERLSEFVLAGRPTTLDISRVTYLGSHALTTLVQVHNLARTRESTLVIVTGRNQAVQRVLELSGLGGTIRIVPALGGDVTPPGAD